MSLMVISFKYLFVVVCTFTITHVQCAYNEQQHPMSVIKAPQIHIRLIAVKTYRPNAFCKCIDYLSSFHLFNESVPLYAMQTSKHNISVNYILKREIASSPTIVSHIM